eukprot:TRINITY_DN8587_c1_g1_i1.p1 TRINITY_DN8587_c1_g1~~TRINITY_DN8587_c1_g1_i1.p1  ORF type:complete len:229 (+),score=-6.78 TRINITY_DN8587_c1_g1_i1:699-1385(+)
MVGVCGDAILSALLHFQSQSIFFPRVGFKFREGKIQITLINQFIYYQFVSFNFRLVFYIIFTQCTWLKQISHMLALVYVEGCMPLVKKIQNIVFALSRVERTFLIDAQLQKYNGYTCKKNKNRNMKVVIVFRDVMIYVNKCMELLLLSIYLIRHFYVILLYWGLVQSMNILQLHIVQFSCNQIGDSIKNILIYTNLFFWLIEIQQNFNFEVGRKTRYVTRLLKLDCLQ